MFGAMLGIDVDVQGGGAGYKKIIYAPLCDKRIGFAEGSIDSRAGKIEASWRYLPDGRIRYELTLPENTEAKIRIPGIKEQTLLGGSYVFFGGCDG
jgi:alpha-L-rhamnosidase